MTLGIYNVSSSCSLERKYVGGRGSHCLHQLRKLKPAFSPLHCNVYNRAQDTLLKTAVSCKASENETTTTIPTKDPVDTTVSTASSKMFTEMTIHNPYFIALPFSAFCAISYGISMGIFQQSDNLGHITALTLDPSLRNVMIDKVVSNVFINFSLIGWLICSYHIVLDAKVERIAIVAAGWALYALGIGPVVVDANLMYSLKQFFHRVRPSDLHHSFSYPSGHSTSVAFLMGTLLFVLLPLLPSKEPKNASVSLSVVEHLKENVPLFFVGMTSTALARVMADVHWISDTWAGLCLGTMFVCILASSARQAITIEGKKGERND